ncbi:MAG: hypothetical protein DMG22_09995 [Acidobacteria bacterium]|nr:MAG: hypothetical protein DMG22_09995 [Acidobacteriota bacterium]
MILVFLLILAVAVAIGLWRLSARAPRSRYGWGALWRLACLIASVRISALLIGLAAYRDPGWTQIPGYFLLMLGMPEIYFVRGARFETRKWAILSSMLLAVSSFAWAALLVWVANRLRTQDGASPRNQGGRV